MTTATIKWSPVICTDCETCICSTLVSHRVQESDVWTTPSSPLNPTQQQEYTIDLEEGVYYQIRLRFFGPFCNQKDTFISAYIPTSQCCPEGYTLSPDMDYCYNIDDVDAIITGVPEVLVSVDEPAYNSCGSYIYDMGWSVSGTGASTQISLTNPFWVNGPGLCIDATTTQGPLNRISVWTATPTLDQQIGFGVCIEAPETKIYYIGVGADNYSSITLDGYLRLYQDPIALGSQYGVGVAATFKVFHIYPIELSAGPHILELSGTNVNGPASIGCEVYNATAAEIAAATSYIDLGDKLLFSSKDYIGQTVQLGTNGAGYECPPSYSIYPCDGPVRCRKITTVAVESC